MGIVVAFPKNHTVTRPERVALPPEVKTAVDNWRRGGCYDAVPECYVTFHEQLADEELTRIVTKYNLKVLIHQVQADDGWGDGMRVRNAFVETPSGRVVHLSWHDANQGFMMKHDGHSGSSIMFEKDLL